MLNKHESGRIKLDITIPNLMIGIDSFKDSYNDNIKSIYPTKPPNSPTSAVVLRPQKSVIQSSQSLQPPTLEVPSNLEESINIGCTSTHVRSPKLLNGALSSINNSSGIQHVQCFDLSELRGVGTNPQNVDMDRTPYRLISGLPSRGIRLHSANTGPNTNRIARNRPATTTGIRRPFSSDRASKAPFSTWSADQSRMVFQDVKLNVIDLNQLFTNTCLQPMKYDGHRIFELGYSRSTHMNTKIFEYPEFTSRRLPGNDIRRPRTAGGLSNVPVASGNTTNRPRTASWHIKPSIKFPTECFEVKRFIHKEKYHNFVTKIPVFAFL